MVICLQRVADLHMALLMPLLLTISCFSRIQIGVAFLVPAHPGSPGNGPLNVCVCKEVRHSRGDQVLCWVWAYDVDCNSAIPTVPRQAMVELHVQLRDTLISHRRFCGADRVCGQFVSRPRSV